MNYTPEASSVLRVHTYPGTGRLTPGEMAGPLAWSCLSVFFKFCCIEGSPEMLIQTLCLSLGPLDLRIQNFQVGPENWLFNKFSSCIRNHKEKHLTSHDGGQVSPPFIPCGGSNRIMELHVLRVLSSTFTQSFNKFCY